MRTLYQGYERVSRILVKVLHHDSIANELRQVPEMSDQGYIRFVKEEEMITYLLKPVRLQSHKKRIGLAQSSR